MTGGRSFTFPADLVTRGSVSDPADRTSAVVLEVGDRFFIGFGRVGQVQTAWSLAGATMFGPWQEGEIRHAEAGLEAKGKRSRRRFVMLQPDVMAELPAAAQEGPPHG